MRLSSSTVKLVPRPPELLLEDELLLEELLDDDELEELLLVDELELEELLDELDDVPPKI
jgi:hypothetical protein